MEPIKSLLTHYRPNVDALAERMADLRNCHLESRQRKVTSFLVYNLGRLSFHVGQGVGILLFETSWSDIEEAELTDFTYDLCKRALYPVFDLLCDAEQLARLQRAVFRRSELDTLLDVPLDSDPGLFARYTEHYLGTRLAALIPDADGLEADCSPRGGVTFAWHRAEHMTVKVSTKISQDSKRHALEHTLALKGQYGALREFLFSLRDFADEISRDITQKLNIERESPPSEVSPESQAYAVAL